MTSILVTGVSQKFLREFDETWRRISKYKSRNHAIRTAMKFFVEENREKEA